MESWDDDDFRPKEVTTTVKAGVTNKWEGEDEDDEVKESWEDEEEEKEEVTKKPVVKPKRSGAANEEQSKKGEFNKVNKDAKEEEEISLEERIKRQKESDLKLALETTFGDGFENDSLEAPSSLAEMDEFANALMKKMQPLTKNSEFPTFAENLVRHICVSLSSFDIKKIKTTVDNMYLEKQKIEKGDKAKKNKGKGKVKLKVEDSNQYSAYAVDDFDDFDDIM